MQSRDEIQRVARHEGVPATTIEKDLLLDVMLDEKFTVRQLLVDLETISEIRFSGRYGKLLTETTKAPRAMMESLGVPAETWLQKWRELWSVFHVLVVFSAAQCTIRISV